MLALKVFLVFVEVVCSLLLIGVILLQKSKSQGLGLAFGAEMGESLFGSRAGNLLVRITIWLGVIILVNTVLLAKIYSRSQTRPLMEQGSVPIERKVAPAQPPVGSIPASMPAPAVPLPVSQPAAQPVGTPAPAEQPVSPPEE